jgi:heptosyltransferase-3
MTSLLAIRVGGLGDLLAVLPSLNLLRRAFPDLRIVLCARPEYGSLLRARGVVDEVRSAEALDWNDGEFDLRIGWFQKPASVPDGPGCYFVFDPAAGQPVSRFFFDRTAAVVRASGASSVPDFAECARLPGGSPGLRTGPAVIHPGSGGRRKCWPLERFRELAAELARKGLSGRFVAGDADADAAAGLRAAVLPPDWMILETVSLAGLAALLESAPLYVGNDSGVTHLAAACGVPAVALFRSEFAASWRPAGRTTVLSADEVEDVPLEAVVSAALASYGPSPCAIIAGKQGTR